MNINKTPFISALAAFLAAASALVFAPEANAFNLTDDAALKLEYRLHYEWQGDYDFKVKGFANDDLQYLMNGLRARLDWGGWELSLQFDSRYFPEHLKTYLANGNEYVSTVTKHDYFNAEKFYVARSAKGFEMRLGDFYANIQRGIMLSMRKEDDFNFDHSLRGAFVKMDADDVFSASLFAGFTNILNIDPVQYQYQKDPNDLIYGGSVGLRPFAEKLAFTMDYAGVSYGVLLSPQNKRFLANDSAHLYGGSVSSAGVFKTVNLYFSAAGMSRDEFEADHKNNYLTTVSKNHTGRALYGSFIYSLYPLVFLVEGKDYKDWRLVREQNPLSLNYMDYSGGGPGTAKAAAAPSSMLYPEDVWYVFAPTLLPKDEEIRNNQDARGIRAKISLKLLDAGPLVYVDVVYMKTAGVSGHPGGGLNFEEKHFYGGLEQPLWGARLTLEGGYWDEYQQDDRLDKRTRELKITRFKGALSFPLPLKFAVDLDAKYRNRKEGQAPAADEFDGSITAKLPPIPFFGGPINMKLSFLYSFEKYETKEMVNGESKDKTLLNNYFAGSLAAQFGQYAELSLLGGEMRGGFKCFGGSCRNYPDFSGLRLHLTLRY